MCLKRKVLEQCVLPVLTYKAETLTLTRKVLNKIQVAQMVGSMLNISLRIRNKVFNHIIREKTGVMDAVERITTLKWTWAVHVATVRDVRWTRKIPEYTMCIVTEDMAMNDTSFYVHPVSLNIFIQKYLLFGDSKEMKPPVQDLCYSNSVSYAAETWSLNEGTMKCLRIAQRKMERKMLGIRLQDRKNILDKAKDKSYRLLRTNDNRWTRKTTEWRLRTTKKNLGRPRTRWKDSIQRLAGTQWIINKSEWRRIGEACPEMDRKKLKMMMMNSVSELN
ncbi:unnamed protein product [Ceutorhynchus assimilis]|uniref:Endonuclease-reverse transcriptase n=1 Tax=Ceutorhynchus assimilis TaxID=467358 RepID=A0A9N9QLS4_9CUCU|nr:unnamed protein product [Ceutorhynchus assimilis]